jgi:hypothetical protein
MIFALAMFSVEQALSSHAGASSSSAGSFSVLQTQQAPTELLALFVAPQIVPAVVFPHCESFSSLATSHTTKTYDAAVVKDETISPVTVRTDTHTFQPETLTKTRIVFPLAKQEIASQPCIIQDGKSGVYEPALKSPLSAFPLV